MKTHPIEQADGATDPAHGVIDLMQALTESLRQPPAPRSLYHYSGERRGLGHTTVTVMDVRGDQLARPLPECQAVECHSPDGFEWGYGGSGPAQLALALCIHALGGDIARAQRVYHDFKWAVVARFTGDRWALDQLEIIVAIEKIERHGPRTLASDLAEDR